MDNHAGNLTTEDLAWLGGIIDGEGCLCLSRRRRKNAINYKPYILISNCDLALVEEVSRILKLAKIGHWIIWRDPKKATATRPSIRMMGQITIQGYKRCKQALEVLTPSIRAKSDQAETLMEYINYRLMNGWPGKFTYSSVDDEYYTKMGQLKKKGASETIRGNRVGDKI